MLPMHTEFTNKANTVADFLNQSIRDIEGQLRMPQPPAELKKAEKKLAAIKSALLIVEKNQITELTQQG